MFDRVVLGVDPGMAVTGIAALGAGRRGAASVLAAEVVRTPAGSPEARRLHHVHEAVRRAVALHRPEALAVERLLWGRNVGSAMSVARASGVILLAAAEAGVPVHEYAPLEVKLAVTGTGGAGKAEVRRALSRIHGLDDVPAALDAADAVAVALCHLGRNRHLARTAP
jgi:crossover junction endodeoxyribonuclease RuvC